MRRQSLMASASRLPRRAAKSASNATTQRAPDIAASAITCRYRAPVTTVLGGGSLPIHSGVSPHARTARMKPVLVSIQVEPVGPAFFAPSSWSEMPGQTPWYVPRIGALEPSFMRLRDVSSITVAPELPQVPRRPRREIAFEDDAVDLRGERRFALGRNIAARLDHRERRDAALRGGGDELGGAGRAAAGS